MYIILLYRFNKERKKNIEGKKCIDSSTMMPLTVIILRFGLIVQISLVFCS